MEMNEILVIAMFLSFIALLFTGFPVAYVLGGVGVAFAGIGYLSDLYLDTFTGLDYLTLSLVVNRIYKVMDNWVMVALPIFIFMGILIPPSIMLVIMADQLALSVGDLFMGAVVPGLILGALYILFILSVGLVKPQAAPLADNRREVDWSVVLEVFKSILPPVALIFAVLGSIFAGIATATEASGVGALGATLLAWHNKKLNLKVFKEVVHNSFNTTAYIFAVFLGATCFALVLRELGGDELIENWLTSLPFGPYGIIACVLGIIFLLGFFLDWIEITLIVLPLLAPVVSALGLEIDGYGVVDNPELVWFVMLVAVALQTSFLTPPMGFSLFYLKGVCPPDVKLGQIYRGVIPFILLQLLGLVIIAAWPQLVLWLPAAAYG